jgi:hypothetical protein
MDMISDKKYLSSLNKQMFSLVSSFPPAKGELIDFHFKSEFENYLSAIHT